MEVVTKFWWKVSYNEILFSGKADPEDAYFIKKLIFCIF